MESHVRILGVLHIIFGAIGVAVGLAALLLLGGLGILAGTVSREEGAILAVPFLGAIGVFVFILLLALSLPGIVAGVGLLKFRPWARVLTIILSAFQLFSVPFGTALGIYGLWVLLSNEGQRLFMHPGVRY